MSPTPLRFNQACEKIRHFYHQLCTQFLGRDEVVKLMITATVAREPMLFVGRPGTAKSLLVNEFCRGLGLQDHEYFEYMLTKFTEPSEVMGPVDIQALKEGRFIRKTAGLLPQARIAFLDEIFKANSAILNMLLTIINERKYYQEGQPLPVPLVTLFAASNEIPSFNEFDALKDRFIIKVETHSVKDTYFSELIQMGIGYESGQFHQAATGMCSLEDFEVATQYIRHQILPQLQDLPQDKLLYNAEMTLAFKTLIQILDKELQIEITDRKLIKLFKLILTQATLFNGGKVTREDLKLLRYAANNFKDMQIVFSTLTTYLDKL